jgi:haloacetate dehalogenase
VDVQHDEADRTNQRRIACPTLVLWGEQGQAPWDHLAIWQRWANDVRGAGLPCGHFLPEEAPEALLGALQQFL